MENVKKRIVIIGTSTTAKTVSTFIEHYGLFEIIGFAVNKQYIKETIFCDKPVFAIEELAKVMNKMRICFLLLFNGITLMLIGGKFMRH